MLGVFLAIDGSIDVQIKHMGKVAEVWYETVQVCHLCRYNVWLVLKSTVIKTIEYPLLALTLTEDEYTHIIAPVLMGGLPNIGVCKSMPRSLVYAPLKYQGLDIHNLYTTQRLSHIKGLLNHIWQGTMTDKFLKTSLEYAEIEGG